MSNLIVKQANGISLEQGVSIKDITAAGLLLIKNVKEIGKRADEITIAHALHIAGQKHFMEGGRGDTTAMQAWIKDLYANNQTWAKAVVSFARQVLGLSFRVTMQDDDDASKGIECSVTLTDKRDFAKLSSELQEKLAAAYEHGITQDTEGKYAKLKAPRKSTTTRSKTIEDAPAQDVPAGQHMAEQAGVIAAFNKAAGDADAQARLDKVAPLIAELLELAGQCQNTGLVTDQLNSAIGKIRKGMLSVAQGMAKAS
ncbi:MAG: hypothetical protein EOM68_26990 [Spirochaetia bacterium]|nr:hypothetical protein [Spirochaetia bacterium]